MQHGETMFRTSRRRPLPRPRPDNPVYATQTKTFPRNWHCSAHFPRPLSNAQFGTTLPSAPSPQFIGECHGTVSKWRSDRLLCGLPPRNSIAGAQPVATLCNPMQHAPESLTPGTRTLLGATPCNAKARNATIVIGHRGMRGLRSEPKLHNWAQPAALRPERRVLSALIGVHRRPHGLSGMRQRRIVAPRKESEP